MTRSSPSSTTTKRAVGAGAGDDLRQLHRDAVAEPDADRQVVAERRDDLWVHSRPPSRVEDVLDLGVGLGRVGAELAPMPDCLNPPKGVPSRTDVYELIASAPASSPRATRSARAPSVVQIEPASP